MNDDSSPDQQDKSWLDKLAQAFSSEPKSRDDLVDILRVAHRNQIINDEALGIIEGALTVSDQQVRESMVPRSQMVVVHYNAAPAEFLPVVIESGHSRFPVVGESTDDLKGILLAKDLLRLALDGIDSFSFDNFIRPATIVPESKRLNVLLREFREQRYHMAVVVDEYGGVAGLITIEDILEEIVGDIEDETDEDEDLSLIREGSDQGHYIVEALTPIEAFNDYFGSNLPDDEFDTIGGLVIQACGRMPEVGDRIQIAAFDFIVLEGDNRKISLLEMVRTVAPDPLPPQGD